MSPAPARATLPDAGLVAVLGARVDSLDEQTASLRRKAEATHDDVGSLRTELALLRQAVLQQTAAIGELRADLAASAAKREADLKGELERRAPPSRSQWQGLLIAAALAVAGGWVGANLLPRLAPVAAQATLH